MITETIRAFFLIFAAEMGDKTQIIAMTFATQYKVREVLAGVFVGVFLNHGLAIILGRYLSKLIPMGSIQIVAGIMFVIFGLLALKEEEVEKKGNKRSLSPIVTVALAFFIGELGDKTQLTAMTLSAEGNYPLFILAGTILGMLGTSGLGIFIGSKIGKKMPDISIKIISSIVFIFFGTLKLYNWIPVRLLKVSNIKIYFVIILSIYLLLVRRLILRKRYSKHSPIKDAAALLYIQTKLLKEAVDDICLGEEICGNCSGDNCIIGYTKKLLNNARNKEQYYIDQYVDISKLITKDFEERKVIEALSLIIADYITYGMIKDENFIINQIKGYLELILLGEKIRFDGDLFKYIRHIKRINYHIGENLENRIKDKLSSSN
ncbi:TMEM165/GDT1 family protein [Schnuerera sp.]|uniref:TMEM165/GDT1 family protein n=1 Tax=Schnuerera sp. TaxID=2794844 RepID=UPI002C21DFD2|nr:TMEM165/GDT1 family protein [Schnuerera sp.]HSH36218.1 TMEM165/GDT1 family protein [Schnuerera sp.]